MNRPGRKTTEICPVWTPAQIARRIARGTLRWDESEGVLEKRCSSCEEHLPADTAFFVSTSQRGQMDLHSWCKCCYYERRRAA